MAQSLTQRMMELGVPYVMANEIVKQIDAGVYNWQRLMNSGWVPDLARYMARTLADGSFKPTKAVEYSMIPAVATLIQGGGAARYAPYPAPSGYRWDFVTEDGVRVTQDNEPVVDLVRAA